MAVSMITTAGYPYEYAGILLVYGVTYLHHALLSSSSISSGQQGDSSRSQSHELYPYSASVKRMCNAEYSSDCEHRLQIIQMSSTWIALFLSVIGLNTIVMSVRFYWKVLTHSKSNSPIDDMASDKRSVHVWLRSAMQLIVGASLYYYIHASIPIESSTLYYYYINPFIGGAWLIYQLYVIALWTLKVSKYVLDEVVIDIHEGSRSMKGTIMGTIIRMNRPSEEKCACHRWCWQSELTGSDNNSGNLVRMLAVLYCTALVACLSYLYLVYRASIDLTMTAVDDCFCTGYLLLIEAILSIVVLLLSLVSKYINQGVLLPSLIVLYTTSICLQSVLLNPMNYSADGISKRSIQQYVYCNDFILFVVFMCSVFNIMTEQLTLRNSALRYGYCCSFHVLQQFNHSVQCCLRYGNAYGKASKYKDLSSLQQVSMDQQHSPQQQHHHFTYRDVSSDSAELSNRRNNSNNSNSNSSHMNSPKTDSTYTGAYWSEDDHYVGTDSYGFDYDNHDNHQCSINTSSSSKTSPFLSLNGFCVRMLFITCYLQLLLTRWNAVDGTPTLKVYFTYNLHTEVFQYRTHMIQVLSWLGCWLLYWVLLLNTYFLNMHYHKCRDKLHVETAAVNLSSMVTYNVINEPLDVEQF